MVILVIYDIVGTKQRNKVIKNCEAEGLVRIQKSVFLGEIDRSCLEVIKRKLYFAINPEEDCLFVFHMNKEQIREAALFGQSNIQATINSWEQSYMVM